MNEIEFILLTVFIVFFVIYISNKILSKRTRQKKVIPKDEKFSENLNNLDKIVEGVSTKKSMEMPFVDKNAYRMSDFEKRIQRAEPKKSRYDTKKESTFKSKNINLKDSIIANEIIKRKKKL